MPIEHEFNTARLICWTTLWTIVYYNHIIVLSLNVYSGSHWIEVRGNRELGIEFFLRIKVFWANISLDHLEWISIGIENTLVVFIEVPPVYSYIHSRALLYLKSGKVCIKLYRSTFLVKTYLHYWVLALLIFVLDKDLLSPLTIVCFYRYNLMWEGKRILICCLKNIETTSNKLRSRVWAVVSEIEFELSCLWGGSLF